MAGVALIISVMATPGGARVTGTDPGAGPAKTDAFDRFFASRVDVQRDWAQNWEVRFVPTANQYVYEIQVAGQAAGHWVAGLPPHYVDGGLGCTKFPAHAYQRLTVGQIKAEIGVTDPKQFTASFGGDAKVVDVYGGVYNRVPIDLGPLGGYSPPVYTQVHLRIAAYDQAGREKYTTGWYGAPDEDMLKWNWPAECSWVKHVMQ
jgi:hypothetical protein